MQYNARIFWYWPISKVHKCTWPCIEQNIDDAEQLWVKGLLKVPTLLSSSLFTYCYNIVETQTRTLHMIGQAL